MNFEHSFIDTDLPIDDGIGDYGQTALVDIDRDGRLDFVLGRKGNPERGIVGVVYWYQNPGAGRWTRHVVGYNSQSDVGACALDVDGDGWVDIVCSGVWYRNPQHPREQAFTRHVFDASGGGAHDVVAADIDGDGKPEIVTMRGGANGLCWYRIPPDPTQTWEKHIIADGIHGAIAPAAIADIDGDGDLDVVCADTWYENADGKGVNWIAHRNVPFGRVGPFGMCVRCIVADVDGDGRDELVMCDTDIVDSRVAILRNVDGKGSAWQRTDLPQSFTYGSLHSLAVADFNGDGRLDILVNEQEELLPPDRQNPRWVLWENLGDGRFEEHIMLDGRLGGHECQAGDVDGDGNLEILSKPWGVQPWNGAGGRMHVDMLRITRE
jgi:hypothetical protein